MHVNDGYRWIEAIQYQTNLPSGIGIPNAEKCGLDTGWVEERLVLTQIYDARLPSVESVVDRGNTKYKENSYSSISESIDAGQSYLCSSARDISVVV